MTKINRFLPFWAMPGSIGLKGKTRQRAEAEYYYEGEELDRLLADIDHEVGSKEHKLWHLNIDRKYDKIDDYQLSVSLAILSTTDAVEQQRVLLSLDLQYKKIAEYEYDVALAHLQTIKDSIAQKTMLLEIEKNHGKITDYEFDIALVRLGTEVDSVDQKLSLLKVDRKHNRISEYDFDVAAAKLSTEDDSVEQKMQLLEVDKKYEKIKPHEYDKQKAILNDEPYVGVINTEYNPTLGINGLYMELDWNDHFIKMLLDQGYTGYTDENIVNSWFEAVCQAITDDDGHEEYPDMASSMAKVRVYRREDGKTEVS